MFFSKVKWKRNSLTSATFHDELSSLTIKHQHVYIKRATRWKFPILAFFLLTNQTNIENAIVRNRKFPIKLYKHDFNATMRSSGRKERNAGKDETEVQSMLNAKPSADTFNKKTYERERKINDMCKKKRRSPTRFLFPSEAPKTPKAIPSKQQQKVRCLGREKRSF